MAVGPAVVGRWRWWCRRFLLTGLALRARWVRGHDRVASAVRVQTRAIDQPGRIGRRPAAEPGRVVPRAVVVEAVLAVALLAGEAVALQADLGAAATGLEGGGAIGVVLLVADDRGHRVELEQRRIEVVAELVADRGAGRRDRAARGGGRRRVDGHGFDQAEARGDVGDMQGVALERDRPGGVDSR